MKLFLIVPSKRNRLVHLSITKFKDILNIYFQPKELKMTTNLELWVILTHFATLESWVVHLP
jgi:hypothetical protein